MINDSNKQLQEISPNSDNISEWEWISKIYIFIRFLTQKTWIDPSFQLWLTKIFFSADPKILFRRPSHAIFSIFFVLPPVSSMMIQLLPFTKDEIRYLEISNLPSPAYLIDDFLWFSNRDIMCSVDYFPPEFIAKHFGSVFPQFFCNYDGILRSCDDQSLVFSKLKPFPQLLLTSPGHISSSRYE